MWLTLEAVLVVLTVSPSTRRAATEILRQPQLSPGRLLSSISQGGIALDSTGNIYATNQPAAGAGSVTVYSVGSNGNVTPVATLAGTNTDLMTPSGITVDSGGNIYVSNDDLPGATTGGTVEVYQAGSTGNVAPKSTISGS
ncbi:MAG TPA: SBBP repeat-containing protein, partial [Candidatus Binataceae bacterium]|nr:SBBP repeat-containing protein [Candidatus Binataceae bacterium]